MAARDAGCSPLVPTTHRFRHLHEQRIWYLQYSAFCTNNTAYSVPTKQRIRYFQNIFSVPVKQLFFYLKNSFSLPIQQLLRHPHNALSLSVSLSPSLSFSVVTLCLPGRHTDYPGASTSPSYPVWCIATLAHSPSTLLKPET